MVFASVTAIRVMYQWNRGLPRMLRSNLPVRLELDLARRFLPENPAHPRSSAIPNTPA
jgi:hypothetical protein